MARFADAEGRTWQVDINPWTMRQVKNGTGVHLGKLFADQMEGLAALMSDPIEFVDVLYMLCKDQADSLSVSDEQFGRALYGDAVERATQAFCEALADFFPNQKQRLLMRRFFQTMDKVAGELMNGANQELDRLMSTSTALNSRPLSG